MARKNFLLIEPNLKYAVAKAVREKVTARFPDGAGLTLVVTPAGSAKWIHRFTFRGRVPERVLGDYPKMALADARTERNKDQLLIKQERNPVEVHEHDEIGAMPTFAQFAAAHFKRLAPPSQRELRPLSRSQWYRDMTEAVGHLANLPVDDVRVTDVERVVAPMWKGDTAPPKAIRIASAIARVIDHRIALERPNADPEANEWCDVLVKRLRKRQGDGKHHTKHYPAVTFDKAPAIWAGLRKMPGMSARCFEWVMVTGSRAQEAAGSTWSEIDWDMMTWTIPASRRKSHKNKGEAGEPFVMQLTLAMVMCLNKARKNRVDDLGPGDLIFPSYGCNFNAKHRKVAGKASTTNRRHRDAGQATPFTNQGLLEVARNFGNKGEISTHGFRTTMSAWGVAGSHRGLPAFTIEIMDRTLGHGINAKKDNTSAAMPAYMRQGVDDPYYERRAEVLAEWCAYLRGKAPPPVTGRGRKSRPAEPAVQPAPQLRLVA